MSVADLRHLIYFLYPVRGTHWWRFNLDRLLPRIHLFNGRRVVYLALDDKTEDPELIKEAFGDPSIEFVLGQNDPNLREMPAFKNVLLPAVADLDGVTFYAHGKGCSPSRGNDPYIRNWVWNLYHHNLKESVPPLLDRYEAVGVYRILYWHCHSPWHYSGTFFWLRNEAVFRRHRRNWRYVVQSPYGPEGYPGRLIPYEASACVYGDNRGNLYTYLE